jgi:hypothetical protein
VTSTGALGIVIVNGKQKLYLPTTKKNAAGHSLISVVDVGVVGNGIAGAAALITDIDLGTSTDVAILAAADPTMVIAGSGTTRTIWIIDPQTDTLTKTTALDPSTKKTGSFSSHTVQDTYMNGVAIDSPHRIAYVSVWNGFAVFDMSTMAFTGTILAEPTENFVFDAVHQRLYAPFYGCLQSGEGTPPASCNNGLAPTSIFGHNVTDSLNVVDLTDGTVYTYVDPAGSQTNTPLGTEPDSVGVDPSTQLVIVADETQDQYALDFSQAVFDKANGTVTAPHQAISTHLAGTGMDALNGVSIEPTKHFAFFEAEEATTCGAGNNIDVGFLNLAGFALGTPLAQVTCDPSLTAIYGCDAGTLGVGQADAGNCAASGGTCGYSATGCATGLAGDPSAYTCGGPSYELIDGSIALSNCCLPLITVLNGATVPGYVTAAMPAPPYDGGAGAPCTAGSPFSYWENPLDPHGVTTTQGIVGGKSVAFLLDVVGTLGANGDAAYPEPYGAYRYVARIDLEIMSTLTGATPGYLTAAELAPALTYLDVLTPEP